MRPVPDTPSRHLLNQVPRLSLVFWLIKILSTTVGETGADYLAVPAGLDPAPTAALTIALLAAARLYQLRQPRDPRHLWGGQAGRPSIADVLAGVHPHPSARGIAGRPVVAVAGVRRRGLGYGEHQRGVPGGHRNAGGHFRKSSRFAAPGKLTVSASC
jgi:hypothetical protein